MPIRHSIDGKERKLRAKAVRCCSANIRIEAVKPVPKMGPLPTVSLRTTYYENIG
jgi:hypothetical protein